MVKTMATHGKAMASLEPADCVDTSGKVVNRGPTSTIPGLNPAC